MAINFDGSNKLISLTTESTISVRELWSRWVDWLLTDDNSKYLPAFSSVGGNDIDTSAGTKIPIYAFLTNGWKVKPREANHTLNVTDGILLVDGGGDPFVNTTGSYVVRINYQQPVQAISFDSGGGTGGLTTEEHDQLMSIPLSAGLTTDEHNQLMSISPSGLTEDEHNQLMSIAPSAALPTIIQNATSTMANDIKRVLGLVHENIWMENPIYDEWGNLTSVTVKTYDDPNYVGSSDHVIGSYQVTAVTTAAGKFTSWRQVGGSVG